MTGTFDSSKVLIGALNPFTRSAAKEPELFELLKRNYLRSVRRLHFAACVSIQLLNPRVSFDRQVYFTVIADGPSLDPHCFCDSCF